MSIPRTDSICFVIPHYVTFSTGGAEIQVHYLVNEFLRRGWDVELVCAGKGLESTIKKSPYLNTQVRTHYYAKSAIRFLEFFSVLRLLFKTNSRLYYQRTDFALTGACAFYCRMRKRRMIYAAALDTDAVRGKYKSMIKEMSYATPWKKALRLLDLAIVDLMVEKGKEWSDQVICQNQEQQKMFVDNFNKSSQLIPSSFPAMNGNDDCPKENLVIWVSNMVPAKQPGKFIEIIDGLVNPGDWRFVMIGRKAVEMEDFKHSKVILMGELSYAETLDWFKKARILVNTSAVEGVPNAFIQAWFNKVLVLSLNADPDQLLSQAELGYCFKGDDQAMREALESLIQSPIIAEEKILKKACAYAQQTYNVSVNTDRLIQLSES